MAIGSDIINLSASGLPNELEDRAFAFCIGTQLLQSPSADPRNGRISFKVEPSLLDVSVSGDTVGTTAIGLATSDNISTLAIWTSSGEISDNGLTYGAYAVSFAERSTNGSLVNVCAAGETRATVAKDRIGSGVSIAFDTIQSTSHGYSLGDAVVIYSGFMPVPLATGVTYYVIPSGANAFQLASSYAAAIAGSGIDITVSGGPIFLKSDDTWELRRNGLSGSVSLHRNNNLVYTFPSGTTQSLRPFFWSRESSNSATLPVFKQIKVSGAS
jgi:hypothetical protein